MIGQEFISKHTEHLKKIYIKERILNTGKNGAIFLNFKNPDKVDVYYLTIEKMPEHIKKKFLEKDNINQLNTIFLYIFNETESEIVDVLI